MQSSWSSKIREIGSDSMSKSVRAVVVTITLLIMMCAVAILAVYIYSNNVFNVQCLTGHTMAVISATEATCTTDGRTEGAYCNRCNKVFVESEIIPAFGHNVFESLGGGYSSEEIDEILYNDDLNF